MDPIGTWRAVRDANLDAWAKGMSGFTNTEAFAKAIGLQLDTMLATSAPMQQVVQQYMERYLAQVNMPSRQEVVSLADRMTNIEMRLDDMQAQLDDIFAAVQGVSTPVGADNKVIAGLQAQLNGIMAAVQSLAAENTDNEAEEAKPNRARRTRKSTDES
ncbi:MAG: hypothetical protein HC822_27035 [Oscillochloris sp.]|nr:hypothetical protein [Oscillochloris sp.]